MIVVKIGGSQGVNLDAVCADVAELIQSGPEGHPRPRRLGRDQRDLRAAGPPAALCHHRDRLHQPLHRPRHPGNLRHGHLRQDQHPAGRAAAETRRERLRPLRRGWARDGGPAQRSHPHRRKRASKLRPARRLHRQDRTGQRRAARTAAGRRADPGDRPAGDLARRAMRSTWTPTGPPPWSPGPCRPSSSSSSPTCPA